MAEQRAQFILIGSAELMKALAQVVTRDPELELVSVSGPPEAPERLVVLMPPARADLLRHALPGHLLIEPDEVVPPPTPVGPPG